MQAKLDQYLDRARSEGRFQSEGEFTLSAQESLSKLSRFQFDPPELWLVKVVQCAVAWGASRMGVKVTRSNLQITIHADPGLSAKALWDEMVLPSPSQPRALSHLLAGLRAVYGQRLGLSWVCRGVKGTTVLSWTRQGIREWESAESGALFQLVVERPWLSEGGLVGRWLRMTVNELEAVKRRCWLAPIELDLDGLELELCTPSVVRTLALWEVSPDKVKGSPLWSRSDSKFRPRVKIDGGYIDWNPIPDGRDCYMERRVAPGTSRTEVGAVLTLEKGSGTGSSFRYVVDGAIIDGPKLGLTLANDTELGVYLPVPDLKVDISQFRSAEERRELVDPLVPEIFAMVDTIIGYLDDKAVNAKAEPNPAVAGVGSGLLAAATFLKAGSVLLGAVGIPVSLLVGGGVMTAASMRKQNRSLERLDFANAVRSLNRQLGHWQRKR